MPTKLQSRIAIFQAHWHLHSNIVYLAKMLAENGFAVDMFLYQVAEDGFEGVLEGIKGIRIHRMTDERRIDSTISLLEQSQAAAHGWKAALYTAPCFALRAVRSIRRKIQAHVNEIELAQRRLYRRTRRKLRGRRYAAAFAVDLGGIAWAGPLLSGRNDLPLIYYALELYTREHWLRQRSHTAELAGLLHRYLPACAATIIHDAFRAAALFEDNGLDRMRVAYVPTSRWGPPVREKCDWLRTSINLPREQKIILVYGAIREDRLCLELAALAQTFPADWKLVFHGRGTAATLRRVAELDTRGKVALSLAYVAFEKEPDVVSSADVSLVVYDDTNANDMLSGFASEKLALSLQCGVPVVAFNYPTYSHIEAEGCGVLVEEIEEITGAIAKILEARPSYRERAFDVFEKYYRYESNFPVIRTLLRDLAESPR